MIVEDILKNIAVQGSLLDLDTEVYASIIRNRQIGQGADDNLSVYISKVIDFCEDGSLDPWGIDITSLISLFNRLTGNEIENFSMAGHFVVQAWHILYEKSRKAIEDNSAPEEFEDEYVDEIGQREPQEFRSAIIRQRIEHHESRNLMLVEVLEAIRLSLKASPRRQLQKVAESQGEFVDLDSVIQEINAEEPEREILDTMRRILEYAGIEIPLEEIWGRTKEEKAPFFSYCLFLAKEGYIGLEQEKPFSSITIRKNEETVSELVLDARRNQRQ